MQLKTVEDAVFSPLQKNDTPANRDLFLSKTAHMVLNHLQG